MDNLLTTIFMKMQATELPDYDYVVEEDQPHEEEKNGAGTAAKTKYAKLLIEPNLPSSVDVLTTDSRWRMEWWILFYGEDNS